MRQTIAMILAMGLALPAAGHAQGALGNLAEETSVRDGEIGEGQFQTWLSGFRDRALERGLTEATLDRALAGVSYQSDIIALDRNQAEFVKPIWTYLDTAVSDLRVSNGRAAVAEHGALLDRIEDRYGVDRHVVAAIWGLESAYGTFRGRTDTLSALATLAADSRRGAFFEGQLIAALRILQAGDARSGDLRGSWAGAMGHTQFMPTSYLAYAVDWDGDGRRNIWGDDPADALASTAAYLARFGWVPGQPWGVEVRLPEEFDYLLADRDVTRMPSQWAEIGIVATDGTSVPDHGSASILLPAGHEGAAFMIFDNFAAIEHYNTADAYVVAVGYLASRIAGGPELEAPWPRHLRGLSGDERFELQQLLTDAGFSTQGVDGKIGPNTVDAIRAYQVAEGLLPDGYASTTLLDRLR
ncbi:lytic murein transglycosylase [Roseisalinus antarcticus]|uniref:Membrane-bound lytic murein transglycosylase B n=1 Tax=Roseisalinus antarcticus TaxID=254357 RepID=A0A1Y5T8P4_9RHOB|nr:lytic murein transglycosylase [Roseisalinus antarcticus]SLN58246.1 Membrane-bound lytic murein transglycosylase B precursor [Roseisalinus antarcticus]